MIAERNKIVAWFIDAYLIEIVMNLISFHDESIFSILEIILFITSVAYHIWLFDRVSILTPGELCIGTKMQGDQKIYINPFNSNRAFLWIMMLLNIGNLRNVGYITNGIEYFIMIAFCIVTVLGYAYFNQGKDKYFYLLATISGLKVISMLFHRDEILFLLLNVVFSILTIYSLFLFHEMLPDKYNFTFFSNRKGN